MRLNYIFLPPCLGLTILTVDTPIPISDLLLAEGKSKKLLIEELSKRISQADSKKELFKKLSEGSSLRRIQSIVAKLTDPELIESIKNIQYFVKEQVEESSEKPKNVRFKSD